MRSSAFGFLLFFAAVGGGCQPRTPESTPPAPTLAPAQRAQATPATSSGSTARGKVLEVLNTAGYTYVRVASEGAAEVWAATTEMAVAVGDDVVFSTAMPMPDFESKTLGRKFDLVYFSDAIEIARPDIESLLRPGLPPPPVPAIHGSPKSSRAGVSLEGIEKAPGGLSVAEIVEQADSLSGKEVAVRGRVVKFTGGVLGKNWLHLRDGSGTDGGADVTVTTEGMAAVGDLVIARGRVATHQDFGSGYSYDVMIQDALLEQ